MDFDKLARLDENGLAELWSLVKAEDSKNAKIVTGSYEGDGGSGSGSPTSLTLPFVPKVVFIAVGENLLSKGYEAWLGMLLEDFGVAVGNKYDTTGVGVVSQTIAEWGTTVKWYSSFPGWQYNSSGYTYYYVAIG